MTMNEYREIWCQLIILLTIHCIADYPLQGDFLANIKGKNPFLLHIHAFIWAGMVFTGFYVMGLTNNPTCFNWLWIGHAGIDTWKCRRPDKTKALTTDLYIDQLCHFLQIVIAYIFCKVW